MDHDYAFLTDNGYSSNEATVGTGPQQHSRKRYHPVKSQGHNSTALPSSSAVMYEGKLQAEMLQALRSHRHDETAHFCFSIYESAHTSATYLMEKALAADSF